MNETKMESPCNNICKIDHRNGFCIGCGRSLDEIAKWGSATLDRRKEILDQLPERMRALAVNPKR